MNKGQRASHALNQPRRGVIRRRRRWPWVVGSVVVVLGALGGVSAVFASEAFAVRDELQAAKAGFATLNTQMKTGDAAAIEATGAEILRHVTKADEIVRGPLWGVAAVIPAVGPNVVAVSETTQATNVLVRDAMPIALSLLDTLKVENLKVEGGGLNLQPFRDAEPQLPALRAAFAEAQSHVDRIDRAAVLPVVEDNIGQVVDVVNQVTPTLTTVEKYLPTILAQLGGDGPRTYVLLFQNNAEIRATGGNSGSGAVITVDQGNVTFRDDREVDAFIAAGLNGGVSQQLPVAEEVALFEPDTTTRSQNFTRTPDFSDTAALVNGVWTGVSGASLDGVISIDPVALSYMLSVAGDVKVPGEKEKVTAENAVKLLLSDAYERFGDERYAGPLSDAYFAKVSEAVFSKIMGGGWDVTAMIEQLTKGAEEQRISMWFADPAAEGMVVDLGLDRNVESTNETTTQLGVYLNDASYSKLEYYLQTSIGITCSAADRTATTSITMQSSVPSGLSQYTLAQRNTGLGLPRTTMLFDVVSLALPGGSIVGADPSSGDRDGWDRTGTYKGREAVSRFIELPAGETRTVSFTSTVPDDATSPLSVRYSPTVTQTPVTVDASCDGVLTPASASALAAVR